MNDKLKIPAIGEYVRHVGKLIRIEDEIPQPQPISKDYIFEEIDARIEVKLGDTVLKTIGAYSDFYGL